MKQCTCYALRAIDCTCKPPEYGELYTSPKAKQKQDGSLINEGTKTKQEPVAYLMGDYFEFAEHAEEYEKKNGTPLYTHPQPKREWVGLTPEEEEEIITKAHFGAGWRFYIRKTEDKLKEKNA
jgi:hypothetical protein